MTKEVSIPLWFLRNCLSTFLIKSILSMFPYHYGSYATHASQNFVRQHVNVSIPLWFLRNRFYYKTIIYDYGN